MFEGLKANDIIALHEFSKEMYGVAVTLPKRNELQQAKDEIENILEGEGVTYRPYPRDVFIAWQYVKNHYQYCSKLSMFKDTMEKALRAKDKAKNEEGANNEANE